MLRTCDANMIAQHGGFRWPLPDEDLGNGPGVAVCPDWSPVAECGNGLHGLLWAIGDGGLLNWDVTAHALVVEVDADSVVVIGGKVKVPRGLVVLRASIADCIDMIERVAPADVPRGAMLCRSSSATGDGGSSSATGDGGSSSATGARGSSSATGYGGSSSATGYGGSSSATGDGGSSSATGYGGSCRAGEGGVLTLAYYDGLNQRWRWAIGRVGDDVDADGALVEPYVWYRADEKTGRPARLTDAEMRSRNIDPATQGVKP